MVDLRSFRVQLYKEEAKDLLLYLLSRIFHEWREKCHNQKSLAYKLGRFGFVMSDEDFVGEKVFDVLFGKCRIATITLKRSVETVAVQYSQDEAEWADLEEVSLVGYEIFSEGDE
jgi:hypothetical protein